MIWEELVHCNYCTNNHDIGIADALSEGLHQNTQQKLCDGLSSTYEGWSFVAEGRAIRDDQGPQCSQEAPAMDSESPAVCSELPLLEGMHHMAVVLSESVRAEALRQGWGSVSAGSWEGGYHRVHQPEILRCIESNKYIDRSLKST
jgi:hypothetical protein